MGANHKARSGLIVVSSIAAVFPSGIGTSGKGNIYSGSKIFCDFLLKAVKRELENAKSKVDMMTLNPGPVHTNMTSKMKKSACQFWAKSEDCVDSALRDLGKETLTYGVFKHEIMGTLAKSANHWLTLGEKSK